MEKYIIEDGTYKFIYKLPSNSLLEFDFSFKKGENYENIMFENFEQEKIPKIILSDLNILMQQFLYEERKEKRILTKVQKENLNSKNYLQKIIHEWLSIKTFKNHLELNFNNNKHISQNWQKLTIIKFYKKFEKIVEFEKIVSENYNKLLMQKENNENELRNKQEKEMQEANIKNLQLDLIVNRHIGELDKFIKEYEDIILDFKNNCKDSFLKIIEQSFQSFIENIDPGLIIYNSENKLIQIKTKGGSGVSTIDNSDTKSVKSTKSFDKKNSVVNLNTIDDLFFTHKINFGIFNKNKLNFYFFKVSDHIDNDLKIKFAHYHHNIHAKNIKVSDNEDTAINDILKSSDNFGDNVFAMINFFMFDNSESKIVHMFDSLKTVTSKIQNELFYDTIVKFFLKIENQCKKGNFPYEYDIFATKHSAMQSFDVLLNIFLKNESYSEEDIKTALKNILYFANVFKINILIIPLEKIIEKFYKIHKFSEIKSFFKCVKSIISQIKINFSLIIKSGM